jgi:hypothetical protein
LGFSHEDIIDFDIGAHGPNSVSCVSAHDIMHIGPNRQHTIAKVQREPAKRSGTEMNDFTEIRKAKALFAAAVLKI